MYNVKTVCAGSCVIGLFIQPFTMARSGYAAGVMVKPSVVDQVARATTQLAGGQGCLTGCDMGVCTMSGVHRTAMERVLKDHVCQPPAGVVCVLWRVHRHVCMQPVDTGLGSQGMQRMHGKHQLK